MFSKRGQLSKELARRCGKEAVKGFGNCSVSHKGDKSVVTQYDYAIEKEIIDAITLEFQDTIISEEGGLVTDNSESPYMWIIDPIDGTANFSRGIPHWGISIACYKNSAPFCASICLPCSGEIFTAERDVGIICENYLTSETSKFKRAQTQYSDISNLNDSVLCIEGSSSLLDNIELMQRFGLSMESLRRFRSSVLPICMLAQGEIDLFFHNSLHIWDCAAGIVLFNELGLTVELLEPKCLQNFSIKTPFLAYNNAVLKHQPYCNFIRHLTCK